MFHRSDNFPKLKGRAAEIRHLGEPLLAVATQLLDAHDRQHTLIVLALQASVRLEHILDETDQHFCVPGDKAAELEQTAYHFVNLNATLGHFYHNRGMWLFHTTIKFHYLLHAAKQARYLHPKLGWAYSGEDYMNKMKKLTQAAHNGTPPLQVQSKVLGMYLHGIKFRIVPRHEWFELRG